MATVKKLQLTDATTATNFFNSLSNPYISAYMDGTVPCVSLGDTLLVRNYIASNSIRVYVNGTEVAAIYGYYSSPITTVACDENFAYIQFQGVWGGYAQDVSMIVLYHKISNSLSVYSYLSGGSSGAVENLVLYDTATQSQYAYKTSLNYSMDTGYLEYTEKKLFSNDLKTTILVPSFLDVSIIPEKQIITFRAKNYYSIGTHTLVEMDL